MIAGTPQSMSACPLTHFEDKYRLIFLVSGPAQNVATSFNPSGSQQVGSESAIVSTILSTAPYLIIRTQWSYDPVSQSITAQWVNSAGGELHTPVVGSVA